MNALIRTSAISGSLHPATILWTYRPAPPARAPCGRAQRPWRLAAVVAVSTLVMLSANAVSGATITETYLHVRNTVFFSNDAPFAVEDELTVPEGQSVDATTRVSKESYTSFTGQYPREPNNIERAYMSSILDGFGNYGLGASAILYRPATWVVDSTYARTYRNDGASPETLVVGFTIPRLEASVGGFASQDDLLARASASAFYEVRDAQGDVVGQGDLFDYWLETYKLPPASNGAFDTKERWSEDLVDMFDSLTASLEYEEEMYGSLSTASLFTSQFNTHVTFDSLKPSETVMFLLAGEARLQVGLAGVEAGGQALVGDPIEVSGSQGPVFDIFVERDSDPLTPVIPVPATVWVLSTGLISLLALRRSGARER